MYTTFCLSIHSLMDSYPRLLNDKTLNLLSHFLQADFHKFFGLACCVNSFCTDSHLPLRARKQNNTKQNSKRTKDLTVRATLCNPQSVEENTGVIFYALGFSNCFLEMSPKAQTTKGKKT